jgi:hypothetical protein
MIANFSQFLTCNNIIIEWQLYDFPLHIKVDKPIEAIKH